MQDLVPRPGIEPRPPALGAWSLTHWTTREVPRSMILLFVFFLSPLHFLPLFTFSCLFSIIWIYLKFLFVNWPLFYSCCSRGYNIYRHTSFYCALLYWSLLILHFSKLKVCGNHVSCKSISTIFPTSFAHFMSLCHILVILAIFQTFSLLLYLFWWSTTSDLWCYWKQLFCPFPLCLFLFPSNLKRT